MIKNIYLDLDGVLADFDRQYLELFGPPTTDAELWRNINTVNGWFRNLPQKPDASELLNFCEFETDCEIKILTATGRNYEKASQEKRDWCLLEFGLYDDAIITVRKSELKAQYANPHSVLIDDSIRSIGPWNEAGGIGILHKDTKSSIERLKNILEYHA